MNDKIERDFRRSRSKYFHRPPIFKQASLFAMFDPQGACPAKDIAAKMSRVNQGDNARQYRSLGLRDGLWQQSAGSEDLRVALTDN